MALMKNFERTDSSNHTSYNRHDNDKLNFNSSSNNNQGVKLRVGQFNSTHYNAGNSINNNAGNFINNNNASNPIIDNYSF